MHCVLTLLFSLATMTMASPAPVPAADLSTRPFQIIVETPGLPTLVPMFLSKNGTAISNRADAVSCHIASDELLCGSTISIGAGSNAWEALLVGLKGKDTINTKWSIGEDGRLKWANKRFVNVEGGIATFKYELSDGTKPEGGVYAVFGGDPITDLQRLSTPATLLPTIPSNW